MSTNSRPAASYIGGSAVNWNSEYPRGFIGSVIICWWPTEDVDVGLLVVPRGDGEQRGDRPALDDLEAVVDQAPFDVLRPAEVRFDLPSQLHELHDLRIGQRRLGCRAGSIASSCVPPAGEAWMASGLMAIVLATTSPSRTW